jgi:hypothetical protein
MPVTLGFEFNVGPWNDNEVLELLAVVVASSGGRCCFNSRSCRDKQNDRGGQRSEARKRRSQAERVSFLPSGDSYCRRRSRGCKRLALDSSASATTKFVYRCDAVPSAHMKFAPPCPSSVTSTFSLQPTISDVADRWSVGHLAELDTSYLYNI